MKKSLIMLGILAGVAFSFSVAASVAANDASLTEVSAASDELQTISNDKARLWVAYGNVTPMTKDDAVIKLWIHKNESNSDAGSYVYASNDPTVWGSYENGQESSRRYDYFDVDLICYTEGWYCTIQRFDSNGVTFWNTGATVQLSSTNAFQVLYSWDDWSKSSFGVIGSLDAEMAAIALAGMHSCSSSNINGYGAFANFNSTFVKNGETWRIVGDLSDYTLSDFADGDTTYSGLVSATVTAYNKYLFVKAKAGDSSGALSVPDVAPNETASVVAVTATASVGVAAFGGFLFIRKRFML